ncbi:DMT family transporter [Immundisolibacter sp.]|uniref:DMT family transporter n=1 Tax=Immundisolibacter sp. TaxID=1934948 RepID=UPI0026312045|nr:DMT family transporter [Immundisolibacter sp.]MDD3650792.1 DMT family transporter [Immundisolibacter sp.]
MSRSLIARHPHLALVALILVWGVGYPIMKVGLAYCPPLLFAGLRAVGGGLLLAAAALRAGESPDLAGTWSALLVSALCNVVLFFGLSTLSVQLLPAGIASVVLYLQPIFIAGLAHLWLGERLTRTRMAGLLLGFGGVAAIMVHGAGGSLSPAGLAYGVGSAAAWAVGTVAFKRAAPRSILWFIALPFLLGGLCIVVGGLALGERWADIAWNPVFVLVLAYGAAVGLALSWTLWLALVAAGEASRMAGNTFLVPLVSVLTGTLVLGEPLTVTLALGGAAVIGGVYLVNRGR